MRRGICRQENFCNKMLQILLQKLQTLNVLHNFFLPFWHKYSSLWPPSVRSSSKMFILLTHMQPQPREALSSTALVLQYCAIIATTIHTHMLDTHIPNTTPLNTSSTYLQIKAHFMLQNWHDEATQLDEDHKKTSEA